MVRAASTPASRRTRIRLVAADKSPLILVALRRLFASDPRFRLLATASDGERFLDAVRRLTFDVGVIGWDMGYCDGRAVLEALRQRPAAPRIVVYTGNADPDIPRQVMNLGGAGFCAKGDAPAHLLAVVLEVAAGRMAFPFIDVRKLAADASTELTPRERELLKGLAEGMSNAGLAAMLGISVNTVKFHLKNLYEKLAVDNRTQAAMAFRK